MEEKTVKTEKTMKADAVCGEDGFSPSKTNVSLFHFTSGSSRVFLLVYVDDIIMMGNNYVLVNSLLQRWATAFKIRDLGKPGFFLSIETIAVEGGLILSQRCHITDLLNRSRMVDCKPLATSAAVTQASNGLRLSTSASADIHAFSDSDWAGCPIDRKSTSGYAVFLGSNLISCLSRKQRTVARSFTEAGYKALADVSAEVTWVVSLLQELGLQSGQSSTLWCDNLEATYLCANPVFHVRTKHVEIEYHFVRD
ncbi:PREDICTED: uncharacterized protein LOC109184336 [Ipomoea nil]|uniref:uncharacterized protein LOC109184336 n=1 Tax=Ipomoea nil TaxID=35883 RepID=UPI0009014452|nr:PREDICTED: uncharacterized protein LOC109184336 [Ipomoea nil]